MTAADSSARVKRYDPDFHAEFPHMHELPHGKYMLHADHLATVAALNELQRELEAARAALQKYGKHYIACASEWPSGQGSHQACDCGFSAVQQQKGRG